jgi:hypothetical protein
MSHQSQATKLLSTAQLSSRTWYPSPHAQHQLCNPPPPQQRWRRSLAISHMAAGVTQHQYQFRLASSDVSEPVTIDWRMPPIFTPKQPCVCDRFWERKPLGCSTLGHHPGLAVLQPFLSTPQNLAIKTPSPRPQLHRKRNTFGLEPARRVRFRWISNTRQRLPCALEGPFPTVMRRTLTAKRTAAVEKMAKGPARDSVGLCLYRKHYLCLPHLATSFNLALLHHELN